MVSLPSSLIASTRVVRGGGLEPLRIEAACVQTDGGNIVAVHSLNATRYKEELAELAAEHGSALHDVGDRLISPAFINAHTHLALGFLRGFDIHEVCHGNMVEAFYFQIEGKLSPQDIRAFARMGAYDSLLNGVGLVWDHYYQGEQIADALCDVGLMGVVAPTLQDLAGPGKDDWETQLEATVRIDESKRYRAAGVYAALGPHATDTVSADLFGRAAQLAEQRELPLHAHLAQSLEEYQRAQQRHGLSPVQWLRDIGVLEQVPAGVFAHCIYTSRDDLRMLTGGQHCLVFCPYSALIFGFPAPVGAWSELEVPWVVATDCASSNDSMNVQQELRFVAAQRAAGVSFSPEVERMLAEGGEQAATEAWAVRTRHFEKHDPISEASSLLARVWHTPGQLHPAFRAGVIESGALANLLVWDLEHPALWPARDPLQGLAMSDPSGALWTMFIGGQRVGEPGDLFNSVTRSSAYREARTEASERFQRLVAKL